MLFHKVYSFAKEEGWIKTEINQVIPSQNFIIGIEMVLHDSDNNLSKKQVELALASEKITELPFFIRL